MVMNMTLSPENLFKEYTRQDTMMVSESHTPTYYDLPLYLKYRSPVDTSSGSLSNCDPLPKSTRKTRRTVYTPHQLFELERQYLETKYLNRIIRIKLASSLNLSEKQIKIWFQNRRMKDKLSNGSSSSQNSATVVSVDIPNQSPQTDPLLMYPGGSLKKESNHIEADCIQSFDLSYFLGGESNHSTDNVSPELSSHSQNYSQICHSDSDVSIQSGTMTPTALSYFEYDINKVDQRERYVYSAINQFNYQFSDSEFCKNPQSESYNMPVSPVSSFDSYNSGRDSSITHASFFDDLMSISNYIQKNPDLVENIRKNGNLDLENYTVRQLMELFQL